MPLRKKKGGPFQEKTGEKRAPRGGDQRALSQGRDLSYRKREGLRAGKVAGGLRESYWVLRLETRKESSPAV